MTSFVKLLIEAGPVLVFFLLYKSQGLINATAGLVIATIFALLITFKIEKKIAMVPLISTVLLSVMAGITIYTGDSTFIKVKPTLINSLFAIILFTGAYFKKGLLKYILGAHLTLPEDLWIKFSVRWGGFFAFLAILNEIIWRNFSEETWVKFKVFGILTCSFIFMLTQMPMIYKYKMLEEKKSSEN